MKGERDGEVQTWRKAAGQEWLWCLCKQSQSEEADDKGRRAAAKGSEGSRDEGCGGALFTGQCRTAYCGFVRQQLRVCDGLLLQTNNQMIFTPLYRQLVNFSGSVTLQYVNARTTKATVSPSLSESKAFFGKAFLKISIHPFIHNTYKQ